MLFLKLGFQAIPPGWIVAVTPAFASFIATVVEAEVDELGEVHLRRILKSYAAYYNVARTHWSLSKDSPVSRPVQRAGRILSHPILGGLHHQYART